MPRQAPGPHGRQLRAQCGAPAANQDLHRCQGHCQRQACSTPLPPAAGPPAPAASGTAHHGSHSHSRGVHKAGLGSQRAEVPACMQGPASAAPHRASPPEQPPRLRSEERWGMLSCERAAQAQRQLSRSSSSQAQEAPARLQRWPSEPGGRGASDSPREGEREHQQPPNQRGPVGSRCRRDARVSQEQAQRRDCCGTEEAHHLLPPTPQREANSPQSSVSNDERARHTMATLPSKRYWDTSNPVCQQPSLTAACEGRCRQQKPSPRR